jgi:O-methyltransferase involved in polyketide biosynthesis
VLACLPSNRPAVDFSGSVKALITELTGAGFDPSLRCTVVAEGLLAYLSQVPARLPAVMAA